MTKQEKQRWINRIQEYRRKYLEGGDYDQSFKQFYIDIDQSNLSRDEYEYVHDRIFIDCFFKTLVEYESTGIRNNSSYLILDVHRSGEHLIAKQIQVIG